MSCTYNSTAHAHDRDETILRLLTRGAPHITQKTEFEEKMRAQIDEHSNVLGSSRYYSLCIVATNDTVEHTNSESYGRDSAPIPLRPLRHVDLCPYFSWTLIMARRNGVKNILYGGSVCREIA